jgi:hypothetical protein
MYAHWYRGKMLGRVGGGPFVRREPQYNRELHGEIRRLALERYGPDVEAFLPFNLRARSRLLRESSYDALGVLAEFENGLRADVALREMRWEDGTLGVELEAALTVNGGPFVMRRKGARILWIPPEELRNELPEEALDVTDELRKAQAQVLLRSKRNRAEFALQTPTELVLVKAGSDPEAKRPVLIAATEIDAGSAAAGARLPKGDWDFHVLVEVAGFTAVAEALRPVARGRIPFLRRRERKTLTLTATSDGRLIERTALKRQVAGRLPGLTKSFQRLRRRGRAAIGRARRRPAT